MSTSCPVRIIKSIINEVGFLMSFVIPCQAAESLTVMFSYMYTGYHRRHFRHFGKDSLIAYKAYFRGEKYFSVGNHTVFFRGARFAAYDQSSTVSHAPSVIIGNDCEFGNNVHITCINSIRIGNHLLTGSSVLITDNAHGDSSMDVVKCPPKERTLYSKGPIVIGDNVWIADNVCILPNVTIGDGAIIASNSVVTKDVPPFCVVAGAPARVVKNLSNSQTNR